MFALNEEAMQGGWRAPFGDGFPVLYRGSIDRLSAGIDHPVGGTSACWAESRRTQPFPRRGLLTARHVVDMALGREAALGDLVQMARSGYGAVSDIAPQPIDALVIEAEISDSATPLPVQDYVAQYMPVKVRTQQGDQSKVVLQVTDTYNNWSSADVPAFLELDSPCQGGDSGSLVLDPYGNAAGLYRGEFVAKYPEVQHGRAAHMRQLVGTMDMELFLD